MNPQLQGSMPNLQGGAALTLQGSSPQLQGSSPQLQVTSSPMTGGQIVAQMGQTANNTQAGITQSQNQYGQMQQQIQSLLASLANKPVAQHIDLNAINAQAKAAATNNVNPLYDQKLNEYLQNEAAAQAEQQKQQQLTIQGAQQGLANTQAQNTIAQQGAGQKNTLDIGNVNRQESGYQQTQGTSFDLKRAALAQDIGAGGLTGSGLGQQQLWQAENQRNVEEAQQEGQFQYNKDIANLEKTNTFAQLAQSNIYAGQTEQNKEAQANFDLNSYLRQAAYTEQQFREQNESQRQADIMSQTNDQSRQLVANFINSIKNPGVQAATQAAYGGAF